MVHDRGFTHVTLTCEDGEEETGFMWWDEMQALVAILEPGCGYTAVRVESARVPAEFPAFGSMIE